MSPLRFYSVRSGGIDLYTAFKQPEDSIVFQVITSTRGRQAVVSLLNALEVSDDRLPIPGETLDLPTQTRPALTDIQQKAKSEHRELLRLKLYFQGMLRTEAPALALGAILQSTQELINELGRQLDPVYRNGRLTRSLLEKVSLAVVDLGPGSFDVELVSSRPPSLFGEMLLANALDSFTSVINTEGDEQRLKNHLTLLHKNVTLRYFKFLQAVSNSAVDLAEITWAAPIEDRKGFARLSSTALYRALEVLNSWVEIETREFDVTVTLEGLLLNAKRFEVLVSENEIYRGTIDPHIDVEAWERMRGATLSKYYRVRIRQEITTKMSAEYPSIRNTLLTLDPV